MKKQDPHAAVGEGGATLGDGWDDDLSADGLEISRGGSMADAAGPSTYSGGGVGFGDDDDPFADDVLQGSLELDLPSHHTANSPRSIPVADPPRSTPAEQGQGSGPIRHPRGVPSSRSNLQAQASSSLSEPQSGPSLPAPGSQPSLPLPPSQPPLPPSQPQLPHGLLSPHALPRDPSAMIARYPAPPTKAWETPVYALKVAWRQFELRQDLESLRKKRSPDVALYERALKTYDSKMFTLGTVIACAVFVVATFIFFLPVILRFLGDPT